MQRDVAQRQSLARYLLYRWAELNGMHEPSDWWTGQHIGGWAVGLAHMWASVFETSAIRQAMEQLS
jgi:hypothetical protein